MKLLIAVKQVIDPYAKIRVKKDGSGVELANMKMTLNPFDEIAVEEAVRLREKNIASDILVVTVGPQRCQESLRNALALGADRALHINTDEELEPLNVAKILQAVVQTEQPNMILMGKQSIDGDHNQTGQMLAALLDWPQATFASAISISDDGLEVEREIDGGIETVRVNLPAVITTDLRLNEPRYASLPNILKAKQKPLETKALSDFSVDIKTHTSIEKIESPAAREAGEIIPDSATLISKLKEEGVI